MYEGYKTVVELPEPKGWKSRPFNDRWQDKWWPKRFINPYLTAFYELFPEPPIADMGYTIVLNSDLGAFKVDALSDIKLVRLTGPLHSDAVEWFRTELPGNYVGMEVIRLN